MKHLRIYPQWGNTTRCYEDFDFDDFDFEEDQPLDLPYLDELKDDVGYFFRCPINLNSYKTLTDKYPPIGKYLISENFNTCKEYIYILIEKRTDHVDLYSGWMPDVYGKDLSGYKYFDRYSIFIGEYVPDMNENFDWDEDDFDEDETPYNNIQNNIIKVGDSHYIKQDNNHLYYNYRFTGVNAYKTLKSPYIERVENIAIYDTGNLYPELPHSKYHSSAWKVLSKDKFDSFETIVDINENFDFDFDFEEEDPNDLNIGDVVKFKLRSDGNVKNYYTDNDGIPDEMIKHGSTKPDKNIAKIVDIYKDAVDNNDYYIVRYISDRHKSVQLGFKKEELIKT